MEKCCICNDKAEYYHHGSWWCEKHSHYYEEYGKSIENHPDGEGISKEKSKVELGIHWI